MNAQPHKKALLHLNKAENFQERLAKHLEQVRYILEGMNHKPKIKVKKNRTLK
ncbi:MAG TPA: hypothetical protein VKG26_09505 [Bacteroidia bacterium]|nr:hypothetical protein [Bacteroidia bacterium]